MKICTNDINQNFLKASGFLLAIPKITETTYFVQTALLPGMNMGEVPMATPVVDYATYGEKIQYEPLILTFPVNEDLSNYRAIQKWMRQIADPQDMSVRESEKLHNLADGRLMILSGNNKYSVGTFVFKDMFPTNLSELTFDVAQPDVPILATVTMRYSHFYLEDEEG